MFADRKNFVPTLAQLYQILNDKDFEKLLYAAQIEAGLDVGLFCGFQLTRSVLNVIHGSVGDRAKSIYVLITIKEFSVNKKVLDTSTATGLVAWTMNLQFKK